MSSSTLRGEAPEAGELHILVARASRGELPPWARAGAKRRAHMARVAALMGSWAEELGGAEREAARWRAAGHLHDALRDAPPEELRQQLPAGLADLPAKVLHGPAVAERLRAEGVADEALLAAVAFHTLGHPELDHLGRALFAADFLEPERKDENGWRAALRARMPQELDRVVLEVLERRVEHARGWYGTVRPESVEFLEALRAELRGRGAGGGGATSAEPVRTSKEGHG